MKILIVAGGQSTEHDVSRMSATNILNNISPSYEVTTLGINKDGKWYELDKSINDLRNDNWLDNSKEIHNNIEYLQKFDCVFPVLHGSYGEDGTIQGLFELANVPYVGMKVLGSAISMDKVYTKKILELAQVKQTPSIYVKKRSDNQIVIVNDDASEENISIDIINKKLGFPVFIKASNSGSSIACYKVHNSSEFDEILSKALTYDRKVLIEKAIDARELECACLGIDDVIVSNVGEIFPHGEFYSYDSKYCDEESKTSIPAEIREEEKEYIRTTAKKVFKALDGFGLARCDFFMDKKTREIYFNEINTMPGFTKISMYPKLIEDIGISQEELIDKLIHYATLNYTDKEKRD